MSPAVRSSREAPSPSPCCRAPRHRHPWQGFAILTPSLRFCTPIAQILHHHNTPTHITSRQLNISVVRCCGGRWPPAHSSAEPSIITIPLCRILGRFVGLGWGWGWESDEGRVRGGLRSLVGGRENGGFDSAPFDPMYGFRNLESIHCVFGKGRGLGFG